VLSVPLVCTFIIKSDIVIWHRTWWNEGASEEYKKEVNDLIWKVIWDNKPNQIERNVCCYWCIDCIKIQHINSYRYSSLRSCVLLNNLWTTFLNHFMLDLDTNKHHNVSSAPRHINKSPKMYLKSTLMFYAGPWYKQSYS
jgi:hypothetical protein